VQYSIPLAIFLVLVVLLGIGLKTDPRKVPSPLIDKPLPEFILPKLGEPGDFLDTKTFQGNVVLLNVWASWCVACRTEHPLLIKLARDGAIIYGLNYKDVQQDALDWLQTYGDPYEASAFDEYGQIGIDLGVYGVPETYVIDREGIIRYKHIGPVTPEVLKNKILPLIQQLDKSSA
jgi:cytochrome c biogenesis protein CcmG, thiol:disulfide interchange protein DsbE